jgi:hypothetical protein
VLPGSTFVVALNVTAVPLKAPVRLPSFTQ